MKKFLLFALVAFFSTAIFVACKKENNNLKKSNSGKTLGRYSSDYTPIDYSRVDIGALHNQYIINAYDSVNFGSSTYKTDLFSYFANISYDPSPLGMTHAQFVNKLDSINQDMASYGYDIRNAANSPLNENVKSYIERILNKCDSISSLDIFNSTLDQIQSEAAEELVDYDFDLVKGTIIIAKSSAYLWAPSSMGGYGLFDQLITKTSPHNISVNARGWRGALTGDVGSLASYFTGMGIGLSLGLIVPGTNVGILGMAAIGCAIGSGMGAII